MSIQEKIAAAWGATAEGGKPLPVQDSVLAKRQYLFRRTLAYHLGRLNFNSDARVLALRGMVDCPETHDEIRKGLHEFHNDSIRAFQEPIGDVTLRALANNFHYQRAFLEAGLTERDLVNFRQDHLYIDQHWVRDLVWKEPYKEELKKIRENAAFLAELGITESDLTAKASHIQKGEGAHLLRALAKWPATREIFAKDVLEKRIRSIKAGKGHLGAHYGPESEEAMTWLIGKGMPVSFLEGRPTMAGHTRMTVKFLKDLSLAYPLIFNAYVEHRALQQADAEMLAIEAGVASVGFKNSQWFLRVLQKQKPETYEKVVKLFIDASVDRDLMLMADGYVPPAFNLHHIFPLSNEYFRDEMLKLRDGVTREIDGKIELVGTETEPYERILHKGGLKQRLLDLKRGEKIEGWLDKPSVEFVNQLAKLGIVPGSKRKNNFRVQGLVGKTIDRALLNEWTEKATQRLSEGSLFREVRVGTFLEQGGLSPIEQEYHSIEVDPSREGIHVFSIQTRQMLSRLGMPQEGYIFLAQASVKNGQFYPEKFKKAAEQLCKRIVPVLIAEERASEELAQKGIVGGNATGFYFNKSGGKEFDPKRWNLLLIASSVASPFFHVHAAFHALMDCQIDFSRFGAKCEYYAVLPKNVISHKRVEEGIHHAAKLFRDSFIKNAFTESINTASRETALMVLEDWIRPYLPSDAHFGLLPNRGVPPELPVNRYCEEYRQGVAIGEFWTRAALGEIAPGTKPPAVPPIYTLELHAGFREGGEAIRKERKYQEDDFKVGEMAAEVFGPAFFDDVTASGMLDGVKDLRSAWAGLAAGMVKLARERALSEGSIDPEPPTPAPTQTAVILPFTPSPAAGIDMSGAQRPRRRGRRGSDGPQQGQEPQQGPN